MTRQIKQSELNTFKRVGIDYDSLKDLEGKVTVNNWITGEPCEVTPLIAECIEFVYRTSLAYEQGRSQVRLDDFDRVRYFILAFDPNAYSTCID